MPFRLKRTFRVFEKIIAVHLKKSNNENKRSSKISNWWDYQNNGTNNQFNFLI
jgi:hypothetical protein